MNKEQHKCIFLDRDGVLNQEIGRHIMKVEELVILPGVPEGLKRLKAAGYKLVVITNQSGIARGYYTEQVVHDCHQLIQQSCDNALDHLYFAPLVDHVSKSLMRKPDSLMIEKGIAKFNVDVAQSWLVGDNESDLIPARKMGLKAVQMMSLKPESRLADYRVHSFTEVVELILKTDGASMM